ncbi:MAG: hypothetical protein V6Z86_00745 [Hyphomicrobiales bacterium]
MKKLILKNYLIIISLILSITAFFVYKLYIPPLRQNFLNFLKGFLFLKSIIVYIVSLEILKRSLCKAKNYNLQFHQNFYSDGEIKILSMFCAFPFGLGVSSFLRGIANEKINTLPVSQGMTLSMLLYPTTLASGYILDYFSINSIYYSFIYGFPVAFLMIFNKKLSLKNLIFDKLTYAVIFLGVINLTYIWFVSMFFETNFLIKQSVFFLILALVIDKKSVMRIKTILCSLKQKILFFMSVVLFGSVIISVISNFNKNNIDFLPSKNIIIFFPIIFIPLMSVFMIHPLILFIGFAPVVTPYLNNAGFSDQSIYMIWIVMLINSQLLSPVSLKTIMAIDKDNNIFLESFMRHYKFFIKLSVISIIYISLVS